MQEVGLDLLLVPDGGEQVSLHQVRPAALGMELLVIMAVMSLLQVMVVTRSLLLRALASLGAPLTLHLPGVDRHTLLLLANLLYGDLIAITSATHTALSSLCSSLGLGAWLRNHVTVGLWEGEGPGVREGSATLVLYRASPSPSKALRVLCPTTKSLGGTCTGTRTSGGTCTDARSSGGTPATSQSPVRTKDCEPSRQALEIVVSLDSSTEGSGTSSETSETRTSARRLPLTRSSITRIPVIEGSAAQARCKGGVDKRYVFF